MAEEAQDKSTLEKVWETALDVLKAATEVKTRLDNSGSGEAQAPATQSTPPPNSPAEPAWVAVLKSPVLYLVLALFVLLWFVGPGRR